MDVTLEVRTVELYLLEREEHRAKQLHEIAEIFAEAFDA